MLISQQPDRLTPSVRILGLEVEYTRAQLVQISRDLR